MVGVTFPIEEGKCQISGNLDLLESEFPLIL